LLPSVSQIWSRRGWFVPYNLSPLRNRRSATMNTHRDTHEVSIEKLAQLAVADDEDPEVVTQDTQVRTTKYAVFAEAKEAGNPFAVEESER